LFRPASAAKAQQFRIKLVSPTMVDAAAAVPGPAGEAPLAPVEQAKSTPHLLAGGKHEMTEYTLKALRMM
jgi:hypothetical protein